VSDSAAIRRSRQVVGARSTGRINAIFADPAGWEGLAKAGARLALDDGMSTTPRRSNSSLASLTLLASVAALAIGCAAEHADDVELSEAAQSASAWTPQSFGDRPTDSNEAVSIATDGQGRAHAVYRGRDGYIHFMDIASSRDEILDTTPAWTATPRLAFDASGQPHAVFMSSRGMLYATRNGQTWRVERVGIDGWVGAIAIDTSGVLHVASSTYSSAGVATATHSTKRAGASAFEHTPIPGKIDGEIGFNPTSLAVDKHGTAYIVLDSFKSVEVAPRSYRSEPPHAYVAKRPAGGAFTVEVLGTSAKQGLVAVDGNDVVHLVVIVTTPDAVTSQPVHMQRGPAGGRWSAPEAIHWDGFYGALAVDAAGALHLALTGNASGYVKYLKRHTGGAWTAELVRQGNASVPSVALDARGNAVIAFANEGGYTLATRRSP
jgi:hypothetical protein